MLRSLLVFGILVPGLLLALKRRYAGLLLYVWFALFRPQEWLWIDVKPLRLSLILSMLVVVPWAWFATRRASRDQVDRVAGEALPDFTHPISIGIVLFFISGLLAQSNAVDQTMGWNWLDYLWKMLLVCLVMVKLTSTKERFITLVGVLSMSLGFHSAKAGVYAVTVGGVRFSEGLGGIFDDNNGYAMAIVMILFLLLATVQNLTHRWIRPIFLFSVPASAFTILCTYSRAGFLALAAAGFAFVMLQKRRVLALAVAVPLMLVGVLALPADYLARLKTIKTYEQVEDDSAMGRLHFWRVAAKMAEDHPLGIGLRNYDAAYDAYDFLNGRYGKGRAVHSSHFEVLATQGYVGTTLWIFLFSYSFLVMFRVRRRSRDERLDPGDRRFLLTMANALIVSMIGFLIGGAFIALALNDVTWMTFALVASLDRISLRMIAAVTVDQESSTFVPLSARSARLHPTAHSPRGGDPGFRPAMAFAGHADEPAFNPEFKVRRSR
jgi:probable O-glycosylation ligase (exosortase A-associated)